MSATGAPIVALEVVGTIAFAVSGATAATRRRMDLFGVAVLGVIVANGGGTLRDLLLSERVGWLHTWWPLAVAAATAVATIPLAGRFGPDIDSRTTVLIADAIGLAVFSVLGCLRGFDAGISAGVAVIIGMISGITGGILRDVLTSQPPVVFSGPVHALAAIAGTAFYAVLIRADVDPTLAFWLGVLSIFALRAYAVHRDWRLATFGPQPNGGPAQVSGHRGDPPTRGTRWANAGAPPSGNQHPERLSQSHVPCEDSSPWNGPRKQH